MKIHANHSDLEIFQFLKIARSFVHKVCRELEASDDNVESVAKKHEARSDRVRTSRFVQQVQGIIDDDPLKSIRAIPRDLQVSECIISRNVNEDIRHNSYVMREGQFMSAQTREQRFIRAQRLLNKSKHPEIPDMLWFYSDEKNVDQDRKINRRNDRWAMACTHVSYLGGFISALVLGRKYMGKSMGMRFRGGTTRRKGVNTFIKLFLSCAQISTPDMTFVEFGRGPLLPPKVDRVMWLSTRNSRLTLLDPIAAPSRDETLLAHGFYPSLDECGEPRHDAEEETGEMNKRKKERAAERAICIGMQASALSALRSRASVHTRIVCVRHVRNA
ncbi:hypothetical protein ALC62_07323 [Cyphomyrmex costatus]|uniref:Uncharacterized protein n=1 Tax=Cyphomyrmex costatus TaxID=456900 RepID=A0A195CM92_9HYME|nr:hypothetical protein ALC62_07323 [Cyphomyrmex costatus]